MEEKETQTSNHKQEINTDKKSKLLGWCLAALVLLSSVVLVYFVKRLDMVPGRFIALIFLVLALIAVCLAYMQKWERRGVIARLLSLLIIVLIIISCVYLEKIYKSVKKITDYETQVDYIRMYSYNLESLEAAAGKPCGILADIDRDKTDQLIKEISEKQNCEFETIEYESYFELLEALKAGEVQTAIINSVYIELAESFTGFEKIQSETKILYEKKFESKVELGEVDPTLPPLPTFADDIYPTEEPVGPTEAILEPTHEITSTPIVTEEIVPTEAPTDITNIVTPSVAPTVAPTKTPATQPTSNPSPTPTKAASNSLAYDINNYLVVDKSEWVTGDENIFTCYLSGIDTYGPPDTRSRSDVNILVVVNLNTHQVLMINTPRDFYVPLYGANMRDKLTHAGVFGINTSINTLQQLYGVKIDYYAKINFSGFEKVIDALGGVDVESKYAFKNITVGMNHLDGKNALVFARERKTLPGGDMTRGKNQMLVINAIINKLLSVDALLNINSLLDSVEGCVVTNMPYSKIASLVKKQLDEGSSWDIKTYSVVETEAYDRSYAMGGKITWVGVPVESTVITARNKIYSVYKNERID